METVKADSSVTSASVGNVPLSDAVNTDSSTIAPAPLKDTNTASLPDTVKPDIPNKAIKPKPKTIGKQTRQQ